MEVEAQIAPLPAHMFGLIPTKQELELPRRGLWWHGEQAGQKARWTSEPVRLVPTGLEQIRHPAAHGEDLGLKHAP